MRKPVERMSPAELRAHFTSADLKAMADAAANQPGFDPAFRDRITCAAGLDDPAAGHGDPPVPGRGSAEPRPLTQADGDSGT
jgi:hypothetical protein